ncbi:hypothetical protein PG987_008070 [Apiospora arundinis]
MTDDIELVSGGDAVIANPPAWTSVNRRPSRISRTRSSLYVNVCDQCYRRKLGCSRAKPTCDRCQHAGRQCTYSLNRPAGRPRRANSDRNRDGTAFSIPNREDIRRRESKKAVYPNTNTLSGSISHLTDGDAGLMCNRQPVPPIQNDSSGDLTSPTLVGSSSSESVFFIDPAICSRSPRRPDYRPAAESRTPKTLVHQRETAPGRQNDQDNLPSGNSAEEIYCQGFHPISRSDAVFDNPESSRHTGLPTDHPTTSQIEAEIMDFDFEGNDHYVLGHDPSDTASVSDSSVDGCFCLADLVQSAEAKADLGQTKAGSLEVVRRLNEASERLIHCEENHGGILYSMLLALYEDAESCLSLAQLCGPKQRRPSPTGAVGLGKSNNNSNSNNAGVTLHGTAADMEAGSSIFTSIIFKAFTALSTVVAALPFKPGTNLDQAHQDVVIAYAQKLRNKFGSRLIEIRAGAVAAAEKQV